jgi:hypothetical protein
MTCVISDAGTVTLPEYLSSLLVFSELGNKSNMTCVISDAGTVTLPEYSSSHLAFSELGLTQSLVSFVVFCRSLSFCLIFRLTIVLTIVLTINLKNHVRKSSYFASSEYDNFFSREKTLHERSLYYHPRTIRSRSRRRNRTLIKCSTIIDVLIYDKVHALNDEGEIRKRIQFD